MIIVKRTFAAKKFPAGSEERARLNVDWRTNDILPEYKYGLTDDNHRTIDQQFRTKREAQQYVRERNRPKKPANLLDQIKDNNLTLECIALLCNTDPDNAGFRVDLRSTPPIRNPAFVADATRAYLKTLLAKIPRGSKP